MADLSFTTILADGRARRVRVTGVPKVAGVVSNHAFTIAAKFSETLNDGETQALPEHLVHDILDCAACGPTFKKDWKPPSGIGFATW